MHKSLADALAMSLVLKVAASNPGTILSLTDAQSGSHHAQLLADFVRDFSLRLQNDLSNELTLANISNLLFR
ncbi:hypothetical protein [Aquitalea sp. ASV11]|uniref:hypothetical protein n=1 Tax=Aquitalea sp. ASV11 TaxID=2795103 RepID=UPI0018EB56E6|nr:hypothetical protein [Aquitalea sp. ASV11]